MHSDVPRPGVVGFGMQFLTPCFCDATAALSSTLWLGPHCPHTISLSNRQVSSYIAPQSATHYRIIIHLCTYASSAYTRMHFSYTGHIAFTHPAHIHASISHTLHILHLITSISHMCLHFPYAPLFPIRASITHTRLHFPYVPPFHAHHAFMTASSAHYFLVLQIVELLSGCAISYALSHYHPRIRGLLHCLVDS